MILYIVATLLLHQSICFIQMYIHLIGVLILTVIPRCEVPLNVNRPSCKIVPFFLTIKDNIEVGVACCVDGTAVRWIVFRIETNSMLCLPPSASSEIQPPLFDPS